MAEKENNKYEYDKPLSPLIFQSKTKHDEFYGIRNEYDNPSSPFIFPSKSEHDKFYGISDEHNEYDEALNSSVVAMSERPLLQNDTTITHYKQNEEMILPFPTEQREKSIQHNVIFPPKKLCAEERKITPLNTLEKILMFIPIRVLNKAVYIYENNSYKYISPDRVESVIMSYCRDEMNIIGRPGFLKEIHMLLFSYPDIQIKEEDINYNLISFYDGILDISTKNFFPASEDVFSPNQLSCYYNVLTPSCWKFDMFIKRITGNDTVLERRIWEFMGYCLSGDTLGKKIFVLQGVANSGKSLLCDLLARLFVNENVSATSIFNLDKPFGLSNLIGKYLCISGDLPPLPLNPSVVSLLKQASGNDTMNATVKYLPSVDFKCRARLILTSNFTVKWTYCDPAFEERLVVIPFRYSIPVKERNVNLLKELLCEKTAIIRKALQYYEILLQNKYCFSGNYMLNDPTCCSDAKNEMYYSTDMDIEKFLLNTIERSENSFISISELHLRFMKQFYEISLTLFAKKCYYIAEELFDAPKFKRRSDGSDSLKHGILHVNFIKE